MKKSLSFVLVFLVAIFFLPVFSHAATSTDIQAQIDSITKQQQALLDEQKQLESQLDATTAQKQTLQNAINALNLSKQKLQNDLKITTSNIATTNLKINAISSDIDENQAEITIHQAGIAEALRKLSSYDAYPLMLKVLSSDTLSESWSDANDLKNAESSLSEEAAALKDAQDALVQNKSAVETQKSSLVDYQTELKGQQQIIQQTQTQKNQLLVQTKNQEAAYQKLIADNKAKEDAFEQALFIFQSQLKAAPASDAPDAKHGLLAFPLAHIVVTQQFGKTADSARLYASGTHSGTDFGTPVGTPVMSAGNGVVGGMGNTDDEKSCLSYGRWLYITYDNGLSSIYGHLSSITVKTGDPVKVGQVVAYSGGQPGVYGSGYATGPHLHMGLFNTAGVTIQKYSASIGCKLVSLPLANPSDYLDPMAYLPVLQ